MKSLSTLLGVALFAQSSLQHARPLPPTGDKILTPNSSTPPDPGCKLLASDKGFPDNATWAKELPQAMPKPRGTLGPDFIVQAKNVSDVQAAVNFARNHKVRFSIITTGHDFHGREGARSGLRLDLSALHDPIVFANGWKCGDNLAPKGVVARKVDDSNEYQEPVPGARKPKYKFFKRHEPGEDDGDEVAAFNVIKPQAGVQAVARVPAGTYHELFYDAADKSGLFVMGAQHGGVGTIGGWAQAGGHNPLAHEYGMQADQILEYEVVTADGKFQKVSNCNGANSELFWALRGGGGGTFGVVTGATLKVYPTPPMVVGRFFVNSTSPKLWDAAAYFVQNAAKLRDQYGAQGYYYIYHNAFQSVLHFPNKFATIDNAKAAFEPLKKKMEELAGATPQAAQYYQYKSYKEWYDAENGNDAMMDAGIKFLSYYDGSDGSTPGQGQALDNPLSLIPWSIKDSQFPYKKRSLEARYKEVRKARTALKRQAMEMESILARPMSRTYLDSRLLSNEHVNSVSQADLAKLINQTFPGIPNNHVRGFLYGGGKQAEPKADDVGLLPAWRTMTHHFIINAVPGDWRHDYNVSHLAKAFPDAGGYVNEAAPGEPNWKKVYWGANYEKLESIKKKVDPGNVFWCSPCVGADLFTYDDERICPNKAYPQAGPAPQTYFNLRSTVGIESLPGQPGIENPLTPFVIDYLTTGNLPSRTPLFDANNGWKVVPEGQASGMEGMAGMEGMTSNTGGKDSSQQQPASAQPLASSATPAPSPAPTAAAPAAAAPPAAAPPAATTPKAPAPAANANPLAGLFGGLFGNAAPKPTSSAVPAASGLAGLFGNLNLPFSLPNIQLPKIGG